VGFMYEITLSLPLSIEFTSMEDLIILAQFTNLLYLANL